MHSKYNNLSLTRFKPNKNLIAENMSTLNYNFISLFNPSSIKNLTLYHRNSNNLNKSQALRGSFRNYKVLVKQSYLMSAWFFYYANNSSKAKTIKGFATLPCRQTKHTGAKAPMAHKTFSQEQFLIKYYYLVFSTTSSKTEDKLNSDIDNSILKCNEFLTLTSFSGTNMLMLYRVKHWFYSHDTKFFAYRPLSS
jgi:hypothetical protein